MLLFMYSSTSAMKRQKGRTLSAKVVRRHVVANECWICGSTASCKYRSQSRPARHEGFGAIHFDLPNAFLFWSNACVRCVAGSNNVKQTSIPARFHAAVLAVCFDKCFAVWTRIWFSTLGRHFAPGLQDCHGASSSSSLQRSSEMVQTDLSVMGSLRALIVGLDCFSGCGASMPSLNDTVAKGP